MLVNLRDICAMAEQEGCAIAAFDTPSLEGLRAALEAAEELRMPVIIQHSQLHEGVVPLVVVGPCMVTLAERSSAMVCVQLDHAEDLSYLRRALDLGFTGAMYDGSMLPYERNVENSARAKAICHEYGCGLECELGSMGAREGGGDQSAGGPTFTDPVQAAEFVRLTGCDALAVSFGATHGVYHGKPRLNLDVLASIRAHTDVPLVMHGGSGISDEDYRRVIAAGIRKINYYTYGAKYAADAVRETFPSVVVDGRTVCWHDMTEVAYASFAKTCCAVIETFAS